MDDEQILSLIRDHDGVLLAKNVLDQMAFSQFIVEELVEVMGTASTVRSFRSHREVIGNRESTPISLKVQESADGDLLATGFAVVGSSQLFGRKEFDWHACGGGLRPAESSVTFATSRGEKTVPELKHLCCADCGYVAFTLEQAEKASIKLMTQDDPGFARMLEIARQVRKEMEGQS